MSAECERHGVDLHGDTFSGLVCPVCEMQARAEAAEEALARVRELAWEAIEDNVTPPIPLHPDLEPFEAGAFVLAREILALLDTPVPQGEE